MENQKKFTVAIIGFGGMGGWHADTIARIPEMKLAGIYDIDPAREKVAQEKGIHVYPSLEALLQDPEIDSVTIATPNDSHLPLVTQSLKAGKHVVCEKPVARNSSDLLEMIECAESCNRLFTVHQNRRWDEDFRVVSRLYKENTLGKIFNIESRVQGSRGIPGDWRAQEKHGGGMLLDWGVHIIDQLVMLMEPARVSSVYATLTYVTNGEVDDGFRITMNFDDGPSCLLEVGTSNFITLPRWYVQGQNGSAAIEDWYLNGEIVMVSDWQNRDAIPVVTAAGLTKTMAPRTEETIKKYPLPKVESDILEFYRNVIAAAAGKEALRVKPEEVLRVMRIIDGVFLSAKENKVVYFDKEGHYSL